MAEAEDALEGARQEAGRLRGRLSTAEQSLKVRGWTYSARQGRPVETAWCQHDQWRAVARGAVPIARHEPFWSAASCRLRGALAILLEFQSGLSATRRSPIVTGTTCASRSWRAAQGGAGGHAKDAPQSPLELIAFQAGTLTFPMQCNAGAGGRPQGGAGRHAKGAGGAHRRAAGCVRRRSEVAWRADARQGAAVPGVHSSIV